VTERDEPLPDELAKAFETWRLEMNYVRDFRCSWYYFGRGMYEKCSCMCLWTRANWRTLQLHTGVRHMIIAMCVPLCVFQDEMCPNKDEDNPAPGAPTILMGTVRREHDVLINRCMSWTDTKTVLHWISSAHRRSKTVRRKPGGLVSTEVF